MTTLLVKDDGYLPPSMPSVGDNSGGSCYLPPSTPSVLLSRASPLIDGSAFVASSSLPVVVPKKCLRRNSKWFDQSWDYLIKPKKPIATRWPDEGYVVYIGGWGWMRVMCDRPTLERIMRRIKVDDFRQ